MSREKYQSAKEAADLLEVSEATVQHWIKDGELRAIDIGRGWRIRSHDLDAFLEGHATRPAGTTNGGGGTVEQPDEAGAHSTKGPKT
ncbi:MAG: helix-turn-helix domain-containing protein [Notoacmeibacter sp.]|nr:helix-turn-helix domain-containing protein [Notoacmeibacter sp.]